MVNIGDFARLGDVSPRMLRHYDQLGLLRPEHVDPATGYRSYGISQLMRLHRLVALRDLGFSLEQIGSLLDDEPPLEQLRGMLRLRQAQIEQTLSDEHARLRRVEAHLRALERRNPMTAQNVVTKRTKPLRVLEAAASAPGFGSENIGPVFAELMPLVIDSVKRAGARPGVMIGHYDAADDGSIVVHAGCEIGDQAISGDGRVKVVELPGVDVASVLHRGSMEDIGQTYEALLRWIDDSGYHTTGYSRELYLEWHDDDPAKSVTELQMPIAK